MAAGSGKVALQNTIAPIVGNAPSGGTADLVGYGAASFFEGSGPTAPASNTTAALRKRGGCFDSDNNNVDFAIGNPAPRNSSTPARSCTPIQAAIHEIQGSGCVLSAVRTGRDHERCRDRRESRTASSCRHQMPTPTPIPTRRRESSCSPLRHRPFRSATSSSHAAPRASSSS